MKHPQNSNAQPGLTVEFSVETSPTAKTYIWYFQDKQISSEDAEYSGSTTDILTIATCLPKHKGPYKCIVTDESDKKHTSESATLAMGEPIAYLCNYMHAFVSVYAI